jgi:hypothetical protein
MIDLYPNPRRPRDTARVADDDRPTHGTASRAAPASRADLERAVRGLVLSDLDTRARARAVALWLERHAVHEGFAEPGPVRGPK